MTPGLRHIICTSLDETMYLFPLWQKRRSGFVQNSYSNRELPGLLPAIVREVSAVNKAHGSYILAC